RLQSGGCRGRASCCEIIKNLYRSWFFLMCNLATSWTLNLTASRTTDLTALYVLSQHIVDTRSHDIGDTISHDIVNTFDAAVGDIRVMTNSLTPRVRAYIINY